jgi:hypothetical protein
LFVWGPFSLRCRSELYRPRSFCNRRIENNKLLRTLKEIWYIKGVNYWLVVTRTLLAGFDAPIDRHKPDLLVTSGLCLPLGMTTKGVILWTLPKKCERHLDIFDVSKINCLKESCHADENPHRSVPCLDSAFVCPGAGAEKAGQCIGLAA